MDNKIICALCGGFAEIKHENYPGYQEPWKFQICHCKKCNTSFSLPKVLDTKNLYENIYKNSKNVPGYERYWKYAINVKAQVSPLKYLAKSENIYWGISEALKQTNRNKGAAKILEVGSGLGYLTYSLNKEGFYSTGIDISAKAVEQANQNFGDYFSCIDLYEFSKTKREYFDVVILPEVIEHIDEPIIFLNAALNLLKPNGKIILTTPNKSIYSSNVIWATVNPPVHCWWFSETSIICIGRKLNVDVNFIDFTKFYQRHVTYLINSSIPKYPVFNEDSELITNINVNERTSFFKRFKKNIFKQFSFLEYIYIKVKHLNNPNIIFCKQRGTVICAILHKR